MNVNTPESQQEARHRLRVLVAEDSPVNQQVTVKQLEKLGHTADAVQNGAQAVEAVKRTPYDLILMDCNMPEMDGYEATGQIRYREKDQARTSGRSHRLCIIAMTANSDADLRSKCLAAGMDDLILKPVQLPELEEALVRAARDHQAGDALTGVIDPVVIAGLRQLSEPGEPELLPDLIDLFLSDAPVRLAAIEEAITRNDFWSMSRLIGAATNLKGSAGTLGARHLAALCGEIEAGMHTGTLSDALPRLASAKEEFARVRAALETIKSRVKPESQVGGWAA